MVVSACSTAEEQIDNSNSIQETEPDTDPVKYTLSVSVEGGGTVSTEGGSFDSGTEVTIIATPNPGYKFIGWSDETSAYEKIVTMNSDITISANFVRLSYPLRINVQQFKRLANNQPLKWKGEIYDYNSDGTPDFVAVNDEIGELAFYSGEPNEFNQVTDFTLLKTLNIIEQVDVNPLDSLNRSASIIADIDNNGIDDIITNLQGEWYNAPNFNNGDWNNDGIPNGFFHGPMVIIYDDNRVVTFDSIPTQKFGSLFTIDFNGDGFLDLIDASPAEHYNSKLNVYLNDGKGFLQPASSIEQIRKDLSVWYNPKYIDLNNDGFKDFLGDHRSIEINYGTSDPLKYEYELVEYGGPQISPDCNGYPPTIPNQEAVAEYEYVLPVDIDGDGILEILVSVGYNGCTRHKNLLIYKSDGFNYSINKEMGFYIENYMTGYNTIRLIAKDYDSDGDMDIFSQFFYTNGCNAFSWNGIFGGDLESNPKGFFWRNDNGVLVQTEYEFCF